MSFSSDNPLITNQIPTDINLPKLSQADLFQERLEDFLQDMANAINSKEGGLYTLDETASSEQYYDLTNTSKFRNVYRKTFDMIQLSGSNIEGSQTIGFPHEMTGVDECAGIYGHGATNGGILFTTVYPDVYIDGDRVYFTNPTTDELKQAVVVVNVLKR